MLVRELLAVPELRLRLLAGQDAALDRPVRWVAPTELADPTPFMDGGELILTTGLRQRTIAAQNAISTPIKAIVTPKTLLLLP